MDENLSLKEFFSTRQNQLASVLVGVLLLAGIYLTYSYLQNTQPDLTQTSASPSGTLTAPGEKALEQAQNIYVVQSGDTLWSIAEEKLGDGFRWRELALLNSLSEKNPQLEPGQELKLPAADEIAQAEEGAPSEPSPEPTIVVGSQGDLNGAGVNIGGPAEEVEETPSTAIGGEYYTVKRGDSLWSIAQQVYGDGGLWHEIYAANDLSMYQAPNGSVYPLIHAGNLLYLPETAG